MPGRWFLWGGLGLVLLSLGAFAGWLLSLPPAPAPVSAPPVPELESRALLASLQPRKRKRPLIAIVGINDATETTDYLMPAGILRRAGVADIAMLATGPGAVQLYPALRVEPDATIGQFNARHPDGADYVIVPAMSRDDDPAVMKWLREQSKKGAVIIGICAGAKVVGAAGLLDGKRATTHWYYLGELLTQTPSIQYVPDRRMVADRGVVTTTGITASMPMMLTLIEAIAGRTKAAEVARSLGLSGWDARHSSAAFKLTRPFVTTVLANRLAFWNREEVGIRLEPGMDEVSLAIVADTWSRTYRSSAASISGRSSPVVTANGIRVVPDRLADRSPKALAATFPGQPPAVALDRALQAISERYGERTAEVVAMQLEYPRRDGGSK